MSYSKSYFGSTGNIQGLGLSEQNSGKNASSRSVMFLIDPKTNTKTLY